MRRIGFLAILCAAMAIAPAARADQTYTRTITFAANHQNPWGYITDPTTGLPVAMDYGHFDYTKTTKELLLLVKNNIPVIGNYINSDGTIDHDFDIGLFIGDSVGLDTGAGLSLQVHNAAIGLEFESIATGGDVGLTYPGSVTLTYPDPNTVYPGDTFTVKATWNPNSSGGSMASTASSYELKLSVLIKMDVTLDAVVKLGGSTIWQDKLLTVAQFGGGPVGSPTEFDKLTLVDVNNDILTAGRFALTNKGQFTAFDNVLQGNFIHAPGVATSTVPSGSSAIVQSSGQDTFLTLKLDVTNLILAILGLPPFEGQTCVVKSDFQLCADIHVLDLFGELDFALKDIFQFQGTPAVTVQLPNGEVHTSDSSGNIVLTMPMSTPGSASNNLTLAPSFALANTNTMSHASYLNIAPSVKFQPFEVGLCIDVFGAINDCLTFKPIDDILLWGTNFDIDFLTPNPKTFALPGLNVVATDAFQVAGYTYPAPTISSVTPMYRALNLGAFSLGVAGTGFVPPHLNGASTLPGSTVSWDGSPRSTTFIDGQTLSAGIAAADAGVEGRHQVTVTNPSPGGGVSNTATVIIDGTGPAITVVATPSILNQVSKPGSVAAVTISGKCVDAGVGVDPTTATFAVVDEYGVAQFQPSGPVALAPDGTYSFVITLQPTRQPTDADGRQYTITVRAKDKVGNAGQQSTIVTVPH